MTNTLQVTIENNLVISRLNGLGKGSTLCGYVNKEQVEQIISNHNKCEALKPSVVNALAYIK
jgi:hypothetical protein